MAASMVVNSNEKTNPVWAGDPLDAEHLLPGVKLDAAQFNAPDAVIVTVGVAGAAQGATSVPVAALSGAIPNGTTMRFSADEYATLSAAAAAGATSLTVVALVNALESGDTYTYPGVKVKSIPRGTIIGRTITERDANTAFGPAADGDVHTTGEVFILAFDVPDVNLNNDGVPYRPGSTVKENKLPTQPSGVAFSGLSSTLKNELRRRYICYMGAD